MIINIRKSNLHNFKIGFYSKKNLARDFFQDVSEKSGDSESEVEEDEYEKAIEAAGKVLKSDDSDDEEEDDKDEDGDDDDDGNNDHDEYRDDEDHDPPGGGSNLRPKGSDSPSDRDEKQGRRNDHKTDASSGNKKKGSPLKKKLQDKLQEIVIESAANKSEAVKLEIMQLRRAFYKLLRGSDGGDSSDDSTGDSDYYARNCLVTGGDEMTGNSKVDIWFKYDCGY